MRLTTTLALTIAAAAFPAGQPAGGQRAESQLHRIAVVVHKQNLVAVLSPEELRRLFLRQKLVWPDGEMVTVFERPSREPVRRDFSQTVIGKTPEELHEYWLNLKLTRGLDAPKVLRSADLVKAYLLRVRGGIGYVNEDEVDKAAMAVVAWIEPKHDG